MLALYGIWKWIVLTFSQIKEVVSIFYNRLTGFFRAKNNPDFYEGPLLKHMKHSLFSYVKHHSHAVPCRRAGQSVV